MIVRRRKIQEWATSDLRIPVSTRLEIPLTDLDEIYRIAPAKILSHPILKRFFRYVLVSVPLLNSLMVLSAVFTFLGSTSSGEAFHFAQVAPSFLLGVKHSSVAI